MADSVKLLTENRSKSDSYKIFFCDVCQKSVHFNDKENHINGNKHQYRVRKNNRNSGDELDAALECPVCTTKFTNEDFYKNHLGSKTHKRNYKRQQKLIEDSQGDGQSVDLVKSFSGKPIGRRMIKSVGADESISLEALTEFPDYYYHREKYHVKNTKLDEGQLRLYIYSAVAYWAVSLALDANVKDYRISVNSREWKGFGDVIIELHSIDSGEAETYVIKFKQVSDNMKTIDSVTNGKFNFRKTIAKLWESTSTEDVRSVKFVYFTTAQLSKDIGKTFMVKPASGEENVAIKLKPTSNKRKDVLNTTNDNENVYAFTPDKNTTSQFPNIFLYSHQKREKFFGANVYALISGKFEKCREIQSDVVRFVEHWGEGKLGGNYKLKKEDVALKIGDLLLGEHRLNPETFSFYNGSSFKIWDFAVNSVDVTVLKKHPFIMAKVCQPLNTRIERELGVQIETSTKTVKITAANLDGIKNPVLKMFLFEETSGNPIDDIPLDTIYVMFWKAGLLPLMLQAEDAKSQHFILSVVEFVKSMNVDRRYLLKSYDRDVKKFVKPFKTLKFFIHLDDLTEMPSAIFNHLKIFVSEHFEISLKTIKENDVYFQKSLTTNEFFDICVGKYSFKPLDNVLKTHEAAEIKLILDDALMFKLRDEISPKKNILFHVSDESQWLRGVNPNIF
ncbi:uncharacterized protein LOC132707150 isoform X2 [Cylas formicarius]|uniref:uncharacterized protein LOC132707150 isoform X2 n=2 Tax=Cylas formicarius TaxID=197179 RepID=UPI0029585D99|nr:uncharacterized protein LOC132707150 isoform X2 [Cylas formicarius]